MWHAALHGHLGRLLKIIVTSLGEKQSKGLEKAYVAAVRASGWDHWARHIEESAHVRYPPAYRLF